MFSFTELYSGLIFLLEVKEESTPHFTLLFLQNTGQGKPVWVYVLPGSDFSLCAPFSIGKAQQENPEFFLTLPCKIV